MSVFGKIKNQLQLDHTAQAGGNAHSWLYILLSELDRYETANPTEDTLANPAAEVLHRLRAYRDTFAYQQNIAPFLSQFAS